MAVTYLHEYRWQSPTFALFSVTMKLENMAADFQIPYLDYLEPGLGRCYATQFRTKSGIVVMAEELVETRDHDHPIGISLHVETILVSESVVSNLIDQLLAELGWTREIVNWHQDDTASVIAAKSLEPIENYAPPQPPERTPEEQARYDELTAHWKQMYASLPDPILVYPPKSTNQ